MSHQTLVLFGLAIAVALGLAGVCAMRGNCMERHCEHGTPLWLTNTYECVCMERPR